MKQSITPYIYDSAIVSLRRFIGVAIYPTHLYFSITSLLKPQRIQKTRKLQ